MSTKEMNSNTFTTNSQLSDGLSSSNSLKKTNYFVEIVKRLPAVFILCVSIYLSEQEHLDMPDFDNSDKFVHFICFGGFAFWCTFWFKNEKWLKAPLLHFFYIIIFIETYGLIDELHQFFTPGRSCSIFDWMADVSGAALGTFARIILSKLKKLIVNN